MSPRAINALRLPGTHASMAAVRTQWASATSVASPLLSRADQVIESPLPRCIPDITQPGAGATDRLLGAYSGSLPHTHLRDESG
jgi:hypothetical protein